jgi:hypothetical protein
MHRRVEKFALLDRHTCSKSVTLDLTVPTEAIEAGGLKWVPVAIVAKKGSLGPRAFTLEDGRGNRLPMLSMRDNRYLGWSLLNARALALGIGGAQWESDALEVVGRAPGSAASDAAAQRLHQQLDRGTDRAAVRPLELLIDLLRANFLMLAGIRQDGPPRCLVKYRYVDRYEIPKLHLPSRFRRHFFDSWEVRLPTPGVGQCESYHAELEVPPDLISTRASLIHRQQDGSWIRTEDEDPNLIAHVHTRDGHIDNDGASLLVSLRPQLRRWHYLGVGNALATALAVTFGAIYARQRPDAATQADALVALLLAAPSAALVGLMTASPHPITSMVVKPIRVMSFLTALLALMAAWTLILVKEQGAQARILDRILLVSLILSAVQTVPWLWRRRKT